MRKSLLLIIVLSFLCPVLGQELEYYLPGGISYNPDIPTPEEVIGHKVGEWHVTHDKLVQYMTALANASDRVVLENRGKSYEGRPLLLLTITNVENHQNLEELRMQHLRITEEAIPDSKIDQIPVVIYQGFSIHGNEPSGSNAALAYAYHLAAAQGSEIEAQLSNTIILLDPSYNPDGLQRFAYWANTNRSINLNPDNNEREYHEVWPGGRTNHYWFDLNRDWLPVQLPESRARIKSFHMWMPNVLTDHHEMSTNSTFFFQPGVPSRVHPLTPKKNQELTAEIGQFHAAALDQIGSLYFTEERYDDYYYGKGSTYPDVNGGIGILFEQASARGHIQETENGLLSFPFSIRNQFTTAISTLKAANELKPKLLRYQRDFYNNMRIESSIGRNKAFLFGDEKDAAKTYELAEVLYRHKIKFHQLSNDMTIDAKKYTPGHAYIVPVNQKNHRLLKAIFEKRTSFADSLFYDISAWTLPLAFNLDYAELRSMSAASEEVTELTRPEGSIREKSEYAYLFEWGEYFAPRALNKILEKGLRAKVAKYPFTADGHKFDYGTVLIPVQNQEIDAEEIYSLLKDLAEKNHLKIHGVSTGLTQGIDLGSSEFDPVKKQKVAIVVGKGIRPYDAGEIWHLFDTRYDMKISKLDLSYLEEIDLSEYTDIILPGSRDKMKISEKIEEKLNAWVKSGGTLIAYRNAIEWLEKQEFIKLSFRRDTLVAKDVSFGQVSRFKGAQETGGAIFNTRIDRSHPINFGYKNKTLPIFRNSNIYIEPSKDSYKNPIQYTRAPLLSGYISEENLEKVKGSVPFQVQKLGKGRVIVFTDNTNFRAFWYGTNKLLMNAIFFDRMM
ncbi:MAG: M14 family zinc carboxypeptidase [Flavobacteriaceae bacterium]